MQTAPSYVIRTRNPVFVDPDTHLEIGRSFDGQAGNFERGPPDALGCFHFSTVTLPGIGRYCYSQARS